MRKSLLHNECERGDLNPYTFRCQILSRRRRVNSPRTTGSRPTAHYGPLHRFAPVCTPVIPNKVTRAGDVGGRR